MVDHEHKPEPEHPKPKRPGALVEDTTLAGMEDGSVRPKEPDGKVEERATDPRESRRST